MLDSLKTRREKRKKIKPIEIVTIADRSGSMISIIDDAIGGYNSFIQEQQKSDVPANHTLVLFDGSYEVVVDRVNIKDVNPIDKKTYYPRGSTALNDAIGKTIAKFKNLRDNGEIEHAIFCIITDGAENSSVEYKNQQIKDLISSCEKDGWQFVYLAANQDAFAVGATYGFAAANTADYRNSSLGARSAYKGMMDKVQVYATNAYDGKSNQEIAEVMASMHLQDIVDENQKSNTK